MAAIGESSSAPPNHSDAKPVVVRVKRKASQSPVHAFWLEINDRPLKRALLDFENLSFSKSSAKDELKSKKVFVQHVETVSSNETTVDFVQSFVESNSAVLPESKTTSGEQNQSRRDKFKKENENIQDQILSKTRQKHEAVAKSARFEQIWRSRKGINKDMHGKLQDICRFYDVVRIDVEERAKEIKQMEETIEDHRILSNYLPLLREFIPSAVDEIESDLSSYRVRRDDYVYDFYTVKDEVEVSDVDSSGHPFPLVQVDNEDFCDGPDDSEYGSDDSNAENNPLNDYPDEEISEEEEETEESEEESEEESDGDESSVSQSLDQDGGPEDEEDFLFEEDDFNDESDDDLDDEDAGSVYEYNEKDEN